MNKVCPLERMKWTTTVESDLSDYLDGSTLFELEIKLKKLIEEHGWDCIVDFDWFGYNNDLNIRLMKYMTESDEAFNARVSCWYDEQAKREEQSKRDKEAAALKVRQAQEAKEVEEKVLYEKLKAKYGE